MDNYYDVLQVDKTASVQLIKSSYQAMILQYHPDKQTGSKELFQQIQQAWTVLKDKDTRQAYDEELALEERRSNVAQAITETISLDDMEEMGEDHLMYPCRCSGQYIVSSDAILQSDSTSIRIPCSNCSLFVSLSMD